MPDRVRFKLCTLVYRCLHGLTPHYLSDLCTPATVHAQLRSSVILERSLSIPRTKTKGFYFASSAAWNSLPVHLRDPDLSLNSFKTELKTHFFLDILTWLTLILFFCSSGGGEQSFFSSRRLFVERASHLFQGVNRPIGLHKIFVYILGITADVRSELSTGRMDPRVGSSRVGSGHDFAGFWRVGSALQIY